MGTGSRARDFGAAAGKSRPAVRPLVSLPLSGQMGSTGMTRIAYAVRRNNQEARPLPTGAVHMERMHCKRTRMGSGLDVTFTRDSLRNLSYNIDRKDLGASTARSMSLAGLNRFVLETRFQRPIA